MEGDADWAQHRDRAGSNMRLLTVSWFTTGVTRRAGPQTVVVVKSGKWTLKLAVHTVLRDPTGHFYLGNFELLYNLHQVFST